MLATPREHMVGCAVWSYSRMVGATRSSLDIACMERTEAAEAEDGVDVPVVYWASRHELAPSQREAVFQLHGDLDIVSEKVSFESDARALIRYITRKGPLAFVYVVASGHHVIKAALEGCRFGVMVNSPERRLDGAFELKAVYHVEARAIRRVWPTPQQGDSMQVRAGNEEKA